MQNQEYILKTADNISSQIIFAEQLAVKWLQADDSQMANMYKQIADSLKEYKALNTPVKSPIK